MKLTRKFYLQNGIDLAKSLIGKVLVHNSPEGITKGIIVETEAYMGHIDPASHSYKQNSKRTQIQYGDGGYAYVYLIYGMYHCFNIVASNKNNPESVLIRAIEPIEGIELMKKRRKTDKINNLCNGPGKLTQAMAINMNHYGTDLCSNIIYLEDNLMKNFEIVESKRINIDYAGEAKDYLWRFTAKDNKFVSK